MDTNILVIGSGISGLTCAIKMAEKNPSLEIVMISKNSLLESNTRYAQGGIAVVSNFQKDSFDKHVEDTMIAGAGECDKEVVEFVVILVHTKHAKIRFQILGGGDTVGLVGLAGNASAHFAYQAGHAHNGAAGQFL